MRLVRGLIGVPAERQSQDCLYLNVWTPRADARAPPGAGLDPRRRVRDRHGRDLLYHGARLARRGDVVVVTINYRLGALGFLNHPELRARGIDANLGAARSDRGARAGCARTSRRSAAIPGT